MRYLILALALLGAISAATVPMAYAGPKAEGPGANCGEDSVLSQGDECTK